MCGGQNWHVTSKQQYKYLVVIENNITQRPLATCHYTQKVSSATTCAMNLKFGTRVLWVITKNISKKIIKFFDPDTLLLIAFGCRSANYLKSRLKIVQTNSPMICANFWPKR